MNWCNCNIVFLYIFGPCKHHFNFYNKSMRKLSIWYYPASGSDLTLSRSSVSSHNRSRSIKSHVLKNGPSQAHFSFIFTSFITTKTIYNKCLDLNPQLKSPPITTRPGLQHKKSNVFQMFFSYLLVNHTRGIFSYVLIL